MIYNYHPNQKTTMERNLLDLDLIHLFATFKKHLQKLETIIESHEKLEKKREQQPKNLSFGQLFHIQDIATLLGVTENTIYRYVRSGELTSIKIGNRHVFYEKDLKDFLDKNHRKIEYAQQTASDSADKFS